MRYKRLIIAAVVIAAAAYFYSVPTKPGSGDPAPDFSLMDMSGVQHSLSSLYSKNQIALMFWTPWCSRCKTELTHLIEQGPPKDYEVVMISPTLVENIPFMILVDENMDVAKDYNVHSVPQMFLIDKNGIIKERLVGHTH